MENKLEIVVSTPSKKGTIELSQETSGYNAYIAKMWAVSDSLVNNEDYSAKYYANSAKTILNSAIEECKTEITQQAEETSKKIEETQTNINEIKETLSLLEDDKKELISELDEINTTLALKANADEISSKLDEKVDLDLTNSTRPYVIESYVSGKSWYRVWSDGFIQQGGFLPTASSIAWVTITYLKPFTSKPLSFVSTIENGGTTQPTYFDSVFGVKNVTKTNFSFYGLTSTYIMSGRYWTAEGY